MPYLLGDIFIGEFQVTQDFAARPLYYSSKFGIKGHNGTDFGCPTGTMVLSAADGEVKEIGSNELGTFDSGGYGIYIKIKHNGYLTLYGHLNDCQVKVGDKVISGQLIGHSNNTGNSDGPHLHFGVAPCDANGIKTDGNNGYSGYIDPRGPDCQWVIKNLTAPNIASTEPSQPDIPVKATDFPIMVGQGTNYKVIANFAVGNGINDFLQSVNHGIIDINSNPGDPDGGNKINMFIAELMTQIRDLKSQPQVPVNNSPTLTDTQKTNLFTSLTQTLHDFIWVRN